MYVISGRGLAKKKVVYAVPVYTFDFDVVVLHFLNDTRIWLFIVIKNTQLSNVFTL